jgi:nondiscriminating glutamyl-tRNA synthetase
MSEKKLNYKTRFAPSPTGLMHVGNLRAALFNFLWARQMGGHFLLRIEDTDLIRSESQFSDSIFEDLRWLTLVWDEGPFYQSERQAVYDEYYHVLEKSGAAYPCFCTESELALSRKLQLSRGEPPRYLGTCAHLSDREQEKKRAEGLKPTLRFRMPKGAVIEFEDAVKGHQRFLCDHMGDFIIRRGDGTPPFMFCNAIDDAMMGVTHALRGDDHLTNTPRQIALLNALGLPVPVYGHFPTILGTDGTRLAKRSGSRSIQDLRQAGFHPLAILNYLARLGHYYADPTFKDLNSLSEDFRLSHVSHSPAHYDDEQLHFWQKETLHRLSVEEWWRFVVSLVQTLPAQVPLDKQLIFARLVQPNVVMPHEAEMWARALFEPHIPLLGEAASSILEAGPLFFQEALEAFSLMDKERDFKRWLQSLQTKTALKGKALFFPIRGALTGEVHGPELAGIFDIMDFRTLVQRLEKAKEYAENTVHL